MGTPEATPQRVRKVATNSQWTIGSLLVVVLFVALSGFGAVTRGFMGDHEITLIWGGGVVLVLARATVVWRRETNQTLLNAAILDVGRGRFDVALALLDRAQRGWLTKSQKMSAISARARIAYLQGDVSEARRLLSPVAERKELLTGLAVLIHCEALSLYAVVCALLGDTASAKLEIARVREADFELHGHIDDGVLRLIFARAALAEALCAARAAAEAGDHELLAATIDVTRVTAMEGLSRRERALYAGLESMVRERRISVYRVAPDAASIDAPTSEEWIARLAPDGGAHLSSRRREAPPLDPTGYDFVLPARPPQRWLRRWVKRWMKRVLIFWAAAVVLVFVVWLLVDTDPAVYSRRAPRAPPTDPTLFLWIGFSALLTLSLGVTWLRHWRRARPWRRFNRERAQQLLVGNTSKPITPPPRGDSILLAIASLSLCEDAYLRGDFTTMLENADVGLLGLSETWKANEWPQLGQQLGIRRAVALAGLVRPREAWGEVRLLPVDYEQRAELVLQLALLIAVRSNALNAATRIADAAADGMWLDRRTDLLIDMLRLIQREPEIRAAEEARIRAEVRSPEVRAFLRAAAPTLLDRVEERVVPPS